MTTATETLIASRDGARESIRETIGRYVDGEPLPADVWSLLAVAGLTAEDFQAAVSIAERRRDARRTLAEFPDALAAVADERAAFAKEARTLDAKARKIRADAEAKAKRIDDESRRRQRELDLRAADLRDRKREAERVLRETADPRHVAETDRRIAELRQRGVWLASRLRELDPHNRQNAEVVPKWTAELESVRSEIDRLEAGRYDR